MVYTKVAVIDIQPVWLAGSYCCWFVYVREKYCWLVRVNSNHVRGWPASPSPAIRLKTN